MKKFIWSLATLMLMTALVMTSCSNNDFDEEATEVVTPETGTHVETITIAFPDQTETRLEVDENHKLTGWEVGDKVTLVRTYFEENWGEVGSEYILTIGATYTFKCTNAANSTFTGTLPDGYTVNDCQLAFYNATEFTTNGISELYFSPKARASQNMKDVVMLVAENDGDGHFAMKILGSILEVKNISSANFTASVKYNWRGYIKFFDNNQIYCDGSDYSGWGSNTIANVKHPITLSKNATTYVYIPVYNIDGDGSYYSVGLSAEGDDEDECSIVPFKNNPGNAKLFKTTVDLGKGSAKATIGGREIDVKWVQLWENGPKFAEYNVGVTDGKAESRGNYYPWGGFVNVEETIYPTFYEWNKGDTQLTGENDTATNLWGSNWRMPTKEELNTLTLGDCESIWTDDYNSTGVKGVIFKGKGDYASNSVFLPAAGRYYVGTYRNLENGYYWTSTPLEDTRFDDAYSLIISSNDTNVSNWSRGWGYLVRAVLAE